MFAVAEHFSISPREVLSHWSYPMFLDSVERIAVLSEIEMRKSEALESSK